MVRATLPAKAKERSFGAKEGQPVTRQSVPYTDHKKLLRRTLRRQVFNEEFSQFILRFEFPIICELVFI